VWRRTGAGHTGFTGTSVGLDPVTGLWAVLLTNAVHVGRQNRAVITLRRAVHDAVATRHRVRMPRQRRPMPVNAPHDVR
jgi:CubicO group peptidase (beta-lactamase class C family)